MSTYRSHKYRLLQDGLIVAFTEASTDEQAKREIMHYAMIYSEDGPIKVQKLKGKTWVGEEK